MLRALLLSFSLWAMPAVCAEPTGANRFLFIIDTSAGMKPFEMSVRETLFDLIYSGARGRMTNGDTYGLWLVNDRNDTSFPMQTWRQKSAVEIAARAVSHVKDHGFKGKARPEVAMADVKSIVKDGEDLTVIFVSNGEAPLVGTPFDEPLNARYREVAPAMKTARATVNTALVAREGNFAAWAVNSPQFLLEVPDLPPTPKRAPAGATSKNASITNNAAAAVPVPSKPRIAISPIIITKETVAQERRSYLSSIMTSNAPEPVATNVVAATPVMGPTKAVTLTETNQTTLTSQTNAVAVTASEPAVSLTNPPMAASAAPKVETAVEAPATESRPPTPALFSEPVPVKSVSLAFLAVGAGAGGAFLVLLCAFFLKRPRHREPSLISQAIARERMLVK